MQLSVFHAVIPFIPCLIVSHCMFASHSLLGHGVLYPMAPTSRSLCFLSFSTAPVEKLRSCSLIRDKCQQVHPTYISPLCASEYKYSASTTKKSPTKSTTKLRRTVAVSQIGFHIFLPNESATEVLDAGSSVVRVKKGFGASRVSMDSILPCPCVADMNLSLFEAFDPRSSHPKVVRVEISILGLNWHSMKSASEVHSRSQTCISALPCSDWESLLESESADVD